MRIGSNPNVNKSISVNDASHRVIIPIYIPNNEGYFKYSFNVLKVCIESLLSTINKDTVVSLISNGSTKEVNDYLADLYFNGKIDRVVFNKDNVGKMNAIIAETRASFEEFITYSDADVFFDKGWLFQTFQMFKNIPQAGFVSMNPTPNNYSHADSTIVSNFWQVLFNTKKVNEVCVFDDLEHFHRSVGREICFTNNMFENHILCTKSKENYIIGAGHFCCTIRKSPTLKYVPKEKSYIGVSGGSESIYLDIPFDKTGLWRLSSPKAFVWHMGNVLEKEWADEKLKSIANFKESEFSFHNISLNTSMRFVDFLPYALRCKIAVLLKKFFLK
jgi:glycosyltransferase involved in cell wall biosynthesis